MKKWKLGLVMIFLLSIGVLTGKYTFIEEVSREIRVGYQDGGNPEVIRFEKVVTNIEDQSAIDNIMMIYLNKEEIDSPDIDFNHPDVYISVMSPKQHTVLIDSRVWFHKEGAVIAERLGDSWEKVQYFSVSPQDAGYLKETIQYQSVN